MNFNKKVKSHLNECRNYVEVFLGLIKHADKKVVERACSFNL